MVPRFPFPPSNRALGWLSGLLAAVLLVSCGGGVDGTLEDTAGILDYAPEADDDPEDAARVDFGAGPGVPLQGAAERAGRLQASQPASPMGLPLGGPDAHTEGVFGEAFAWPLIPLHAVLLPDGRVMTYGTRLGGKSSAAFNYVIWDPSMGVLPDAHLILDNTTRTNIFCATQLLLPTTGEVFILGGNRKDEWGRGQYGTNDITRFDFATNTIRQDPELMAARRWYATVVTTGAGEQVVLGGRDTPPNPASATAPAAAAIYAPTPEVFSPRWGWRSLSAASSQEAYGSVRGSWSYPKTWVAPNGHLFLVNRLGQMFDLDPVGTGILTRLPGSALNATVHSSAMFAPGKILSLRSAGQAVVIDINGAVPIVTATAPLSQDRLYGNATVLADGKVFANGGSSVGNTLEGAAYHSELWDPATGAWSPGATATKARLYHSSSMLLPDGTVLTGGGGTPGPVTNLNAEIYYPPYLFNADGSGTPATRPAIVSAPTHQLGWSEAFSVELSADTMASQVRLIRTGSVTHGFNNEQRAMTLPFVQEGTTLSLSTPAERALAPPGYYMLFVLDAAGVPSVARILRINADGG